MPDAGPHVQVFHFTSRISSAKIKKYKLATERGMVGGAPDRAPTPICNPAQPTPSPSLGSPIMEHPPNKKPRLKLSVRRPSETLDSIAVSRPKRASSLRIQYSENMVVDHDNLEVVDAAGELESAMVTAIEEQPRTLLEPGSKDSKPAPEPEPATKAIKPRDYSRDFMSYYVDGGDEEDDDELTQPVPDPTPPPVVVPDPAPVPALAQIPTKAMKKPARRRSKATLVPQQQPQPHPQPQPVNVSLPQQGKFKHHSAGSLPTYPKANKQPNKDPEPPVVELIDDVKSVWPKTSDTVPVMIKKIEVLSAALTRFGGIPAATKVPTKEDNTAELAKEPKPELKEVDNLLAMFDDDDEDSSNDHEAKDDTDGTRARQPVVITGQRDEPLTYGIHFIQNALKSWAHSRLTNQWRQHWEHEKERQQHGPKKRRVGRPRKFDSGEADERAPSPSVVRILLSKTEEGAAITAFQDVLESGCLQVNGRLPTQLSHALSQLYTQIDHLINQGARPEPPWHCMSYRAQEKAHEGRLDWYNKAFDRAHEEQARQQHFQQQQVMQQMGAPAPQGRPTTVEQASASHANELKRRHSLQLAAQRPHPTQHLTSPIVIDSRAKAQASGPLASPANKVPSMDPSSNIHAPPLTSPALPTQSSPTDANQSLTKVKMYVPGSAMPAAGLSRSGATLKFSCAPNSEDAVKVFGSQAFSSNDKRQRLPNGRPMSAVQGQQFRVQHKQMRGSPLGTKGPMPTTSGARRSMSDSIDLTMTDAPPHQHYMQSTRAQSDLSNGTFLVPPNNRSGAPKTGMYIHTAQHQPGVLLSSAAAPVIGSMEARKGFGLSSKRPLSNTGNGKSVYQNGGQAKAAEYAVSSPRPGTTVVDQ